MNKAGIYHISEYIYAYAVGPETLRVRLKTGKNDVKRCKVYYKNVYDHTELHKEAVMQLVRTDGINDWYEGDLFLQEKRYKYYFELIDMQDELWYYNSDGFTKILETPPVYFFMPYLFREEVPDYPAWAKGALIYQVFVDRFYNGNPDINPENVTEWHEPSDYTTYYGGDFVGLMNKLVYLDSLGVRIIYLNPIFKSPTYHKYDILDYYEVDPSYGTKEELRELVEKAHALGMKVMLDAVFNHSNDENVLFRDIVKKGEASLYAKWYDIKSFPITKQPPSYDCFAGVVSEMPRFDTSNPEVQDYLITSAQYWTKYLDIDGWRLDVADEVSHGLWKQFHSRIKKVKQDCLILGEIWNQSTRWLMGDECDSATNYKFRNAMLQFAKSKDMTQDDLWNLLAYNEMKYKTSNHCILVNLVGSHDTPRIATELNGDRKLARLVIGIMLTYTGMPLIYYGDEIGMEGAKDPDNRNAMKWEKELQYESTLKLVKQLGNARKSSQALRVGTLIENRNVSVKVVAFKRVADHGEAVLVAANFGDLPEKVVFDVANGIEWINITKNGEVSKISENKLGITVLPTDIVVISVKEEMKHE